MESTGTGRPRSHQACKAALVLLCALHTQPCPSLPLPDGWHLRVSGSHPREGKEPIGECTPWRLQAYVPLSRGPGF